MDDGKKNLTVNINININKTQYKNLRILSSWYRVSIMWLIQYAIDEIIKNADSMELIDKSVYRDDMVDNALYEVDFLRQFR